MLQNPWHRFLLVMALVLAANSLYYYFYPQTEPEPVAEIAYSRFKDELRQGRIAEVTIQGNILTGRFFEETSFSSAELVNARFEGYRLYELFRTILPPIDDPQLFQLLDKQQVVVEARQKQEPSTLSNLLVALLPWIIIVGVWVYILRRMREGGPAGRLLGQFGKSGAHLYIPKTSPVTFEDVAGLAEAKQELQEIISFLRSPAKFTRLGGRVPRGILLVGPPGTGKTLMARAVAGEAGVPFYNISASQFIEMFVGVGASRVRDLFNNAKKNAPSIIFVDELDAVGRARGTGLGGGHDEREQTLNQLLS